MRITGTGPVAAFASLPPCGPEPRHQMALHNGFERYLLLCKTGRDGRGGARLVHSQQADVIAAFMHLHGRLAGGGEALGRTAERRHPHAAGDIADIGNHRRGGRHSARAGTDQRDRRDALGIERDGVGHAHHLRDRGFLRHHGRMHALLDAAVGLHRNAEQLDAIAKLVGGREIGRLDRGNALDIDRIGIDFGAERDRRQDRELLRGIEALDIESRIGLGIAEPLRILQAFGEGQLVLLHAGQDVIAGAVQDAVDAREGIAGKALAQGLDDRNGAADRGLEVERDAVRLGKLGKRQPVPRQQRLVGGDDRLAGFQRGFDRGLGRIALAAHQFDEHIDAGIFARARPDRRTSAASTDRCRDPCPWFAR